MGQIVGGAAKPKRCNLNQLSQVPTPAAGEYVLVSYDNSMTANGQGNFDRYVMGDGRTAAAELELKYLDDSTHPYIVEEVNKAVADIQPIEITGDVANAPDEEDLTSENQGGTDVLKFKDKAYNAALYSGLGRVYLRKNIVTLEGTGKNVLTQAMVNTANTIYHIQYDYDLNGQTITLPAGCVLEFDGGSLANGTIDANGAVVDGNADIRTPLSNIGNGKVELGWFTKSADASTALTRAMACANSSECGIVDGGNQEYTLLTSIAVDKDNQCRLENLNLKFTASANGQSMFLFNEATQYAGNVLSFRNCTFEQTNPNDYQNVHCIHLRKFDSTTNGKIDNVNVKNFSGYMFICESYLQECEFNLFKGQYVGGFISFNKEYGTANAFGDYGQGSSNIINVVNSGIDNGLSVNNTITDIADLSNNITATLTNCVWQGAASSKTNFNAINISAYTNYRPVVRFTNCWVEYVGVGSGYYGLQVSSRVSIFTDRALGKMHVVGGGVYLELRSVSFTAFSDFLEIENDTYPRIVFSGTMMLWGLEKKIRESDLGDKANFTFDCSDFQNNKVLNIYHKQGRVDDMLMRLLDSNSNSKKSLVFENGIPIVRQLPPDSGYNWTAITNMLRPMVDGKLYMYRIVFRVFPLEVPTSANVNTFESDMTKKKTETNVFVSSDSTVYCVAGQSTDPSAAEWHEVCVNPFAPANNNLRVNKVSATNVGFDIAVCELWEGFIPLEKDIEIDPADATKLLVNKSRKPYSSASAPVNPTIGFGYFNTSIGKELFWNGTAWVDALGNEVSNNPEVVERETAASFNADANTLYNINADASALVVTLPTMPNNRTGHVKVFATTSAQNGVLFAASDTSSISYKNPYAVEVGKTYLFDAFWNGTMWIVSADEIILPLLPAGYTRKEYIQNTGDAWIDTGIVGQSSVWEIDAQSTEGSVAKAQRLLNGRDTGNLMYGCEYNRYWGCGANSNNITSFSVTTRKKGIVTFDKSVTPNTINGIIDNETFGSTGTLTTDYTFKLFSDTPSASTRHPFLGYLWSVVCKVNDNEIFNGIPCTNPQGVAGLYDIVSKTFFPSIGTDQFVAGPDYVEPTE